MRITCLIVLVGLFSMLLGGCATRVCAKHCPVPGEASGCPGAERAIGRLLAQRAQTADTPPLQILALSGGGLNGAFGAGYLLGWRQNANDPRPRFDIITGVSTGALQAPWVYLDTPQADAAMKHAYLTSGAKDLFTERSPLTWLSADSLYDHAGLVRKVRENYSNALIDRIAAESNRARAAGRPRLLLVASVNLDTGRTHCWDLTRMAERAPQQPRLYDRFRDAVLASSVHPVFLSPVEIDGNLHTDGGAREQVMIPEILKTVSQHLSAQATTQFQAMQMQGAPEGGDLAPEGEEATPDNEGELPPGEVDDTFDEDNPFDTQPNDELEDFRAQFVRKNHPRVHVIVNGVVGLDWQCTQPNLLKLTLRTVSLLVDEAIIGNLWRIWGTTMKNAGALCSECFRVVAMPHDALPKGISSLELTRAHMRAIMRRGCAMGRVGEGWVHDPAEFGKRVPGAR